MNKLAVTLALVAAAATSALAHGGLPIARGILRQPGAAQMYVPVVFWGLWVGTKEGPWTWICEEQINAYRFRRFAISADGAFYATDNLGITHSTDSGCTWTPVTGDIAALRVSDVATDPADGATAYASTASSPPPVDGGAPVGDNSIFVTHDHGGSWARLPGLGQSARQFTSVRVAPSNAMVLYATSSSTLLTPPLALHRSGDAGAGFSAIPFAYSDGSTSADGVDVLAVDPRDAQTLFVRATLPPPTPGGAVRQVLLRSSDGGANFTPLWSMDTVTSSGGVTQGIDGLAFDVARARLYVATAKGVLAADAPLGAPTLTLAAVGNLSQAQCIDVQGDDVIACSNNYMPDFAALALSSDQGASFTSIFQFDRTKGPVSCPAGTPVGDRCPEIWTSYADQLGILPPDLGGTVTPPGGGCALGAPAPSTLVALPLGILLLALLLRRRRGW